MTAADRVGGAARSALLRRVLDALQRSRKLAERRAVGGERNRQLGEAAVERERARRAQSAVERRRASAPLGARERPEDRRA